MSKVKPLKSIKITAVGLLLMLISVASRTSLVNPQASCAQATWL
jgi:hypothetical protein